mgnify:FL=1
MEIVHLSQDSIFPQNMSLSSQQSCQTKEKQNEFFFQHVKKVEAS